MGRAVAVAALVALVAALLPWISIPPADPASGDPTVNINLFAAVPQIVYADLLLLLPIVALALAFLLIRGSRSSWIGWAAALAFVVGFVVAVGVAFWIQNSDSQLASWGLPSSGATIGSGLSLYLIAVGIGVIPALGATPQLQRFVESQFPTRVIVLMPIAIAINIVLGYMVQTILKLPIYLDSIGTILVGVLAGPIAGLLTGVLSNLIWQYAPVIGGGTIGPFAVVAGAIGLLAGLWGYLGVYRSRPSSGPTLIIGGLVAGALALLVIIPLLNNPIYQDPDQGGFVSWAIPAAIAIAIIMAVVIAGFIFLRRDIAGLWVAVAGIVTGLIAALISAPISAIVFGGVTGGGTDLIVAALRQGGADVYQASLGQGFFSDPIDKLITSFVVFIILSNLSGRYLARFPLGDRLIRPEMTMRLAPSGGPTTAAPAPAPAVPVVDEEDQ